MIIYVQLLWLNCVDFFFYSSFRKAMAWFFGFGTVARQCKVYRLPVRHVYIFSCFPVILGAEFSSVHLFPVGTGHSFCK